MYHSFMLDNNNKNFLAACPCIYNNLIVSDCFVEKAMCECINEERQNDSNRLFFDNKNGTSRVNNLEDRNIHA
jgi:hypothetical protein